MQCAIRCELIETKQKIDKKRNKTFDKIVKEALHMVETRAYSTECCCLFLSIVCIQLDTN